MKQFIYADNAATTKLEKTALAAMLPWLSDEYGNASQPYSFARAPKKALAAARQVIATAINAEPDEIYFTSGGTESDNWAIKGSAFSDADKRATITSSIEHHAILVIQWHIYRQMKKGLSPRKRLKRLSQLRRDWSLSCFPITRLEQLNQYKNLHRWLINAALFFIPMLFKLLVM